MEMSFMAGTGEMAQRIREFDWASTPIGPAKDWPSRQWFDSR